MNEHTTLAIPKSERPALDLLARIFQEEKQLLNPPSIQDTLVYALRDCLMHRGVTFLPAPDGGEIVPIVKGR
jgi:hypothetical protein